jgi:erythronate-4-phosphate dehydrogenase
LNFSSEDKTFHLADEKFFEKFDRPKTFINTSRGEVVSTNSLKRAINEGKILGCVLDVWENEPKIDLDLLNNTEIATPHIAGYSIEGKANGTSQCINTLNDFFKLGLPQNWYPTNLPNPNRSQQIKIECFGKTRQEILHEAINSTYPIMDDDENLRKSTFDFEKLRNNYPVRREFEYYSLHLKNADEKISSLFKSIGFKVNLE